MNRTIEKFGHPQTLVADYLHWVVLARPTQATLGALVLAHKGNESAFSALSAAAFSDLHQVVRDIERGLAAFRRYDRINYLMLMMVDNEVHFHVLPRYASDQEFDGVVYTDSGWPGPPDLGGNRTLDGDALIRLVEALRKVWPG